MVSNPSSNLASQEGRLTLRLLSRQSPQTHPLRMHSFSTSSSFPSSSYFLFIPLSFFPHLCCLLCNLSQIPPDCLIILKQTDALRCRCPVKLGVLFKVCIEGFKAFSHAGAFVSGTGRTSLTTLAFERAHSVQRSEQEGRV